MSVNTTDRAKVAILSSHLRVSISIVCSVGMCTCVRVCVSV